MVHQFLIKKMVVGCFRWGLWNRSRPWSDSRWIWVKQGLGLHHREEFMGTKMGRKRLYKDEKEHWKARRALWNQQNGFVSN